MAKKIFVDTETFSEIPIKNGTWAYSEKAEVMLFAWAVDDEPVKLWDLTNPAEKPPADLYVLLQNPEIEIWAHNSGFDRTIISRCLRNYCPPLERWHCTMAQAYMHSLPGSLDTLCGVFNLPVDKAKDKEGKKLIQLFCVPKIKDGVVKRNDRNSHPVEWEKFREYAKLDISAMRELHRLMPKWNMTPEEMALWRLDTVINERGIKVDLELANAAIKAVDREQKRLAKRTDEITLGDVASTTQRDEILRHILQAYGVDLPDLQMATIERRMDDLDLPPEVKELLGIRLQASSTSTAKYARLARCASSDSRLRGTLQFCGASRTGRWSGRQFQPQNLMRPTLKQEQIDFGIDVLKADCVDLFFDNVMELSSNCIRGCITSSSGKKLVVSDLSNIEGRFAAWIADEKWKIKAFNDFDEGNGPDLYNLAYAKSFRIKPEEVTKDQRMVGKVMELALAYGGGVGAFITFANAYQVDLEALANTAWDSIPEDTLAEAKAWFEVSKKNDQTFGLSEKAFIVCDSLKRLWRKAHPKIVDFWHILENTCILAVQQKDPHTWDCGSLKITRTNNWLRIILPSGRSLSYPAPRIEDDDKISYMGMCQYSRQWRRLFTYGPKIFENVCQAGARDVLANNMPAIEVAGYEIVSTSHDETITEAPDKKEFSAEHLSRLLSVQPLWGHDLPLAATGYESYRYRKG